MMGSGLFSTNFVTQFWATFNAWVAQFLDGTTDMSAYILFGLALMVVGLVIRTIRRSSQVMSQDAPQAGQSSAGSYRNE